ncbi:glycoside hydrolase family 130 protein [candidate division WOR-3 bacterium]|nr:glycoside hydrolase family 130 protein [candidate division WOR-3 bacterium]
MLVERKGLILQPSHERVLIRPFIPENSARREKIISRVMNLSEKSTSELLKQIIDEFKTRHQDIKSVFRKNYENVRRWTITDMPLSEDRELLIGAYFTQEYSLESAALFNPSIVPHPNQKNLAKGSLRFILSLRATGEGHISSIVFREGVITENSEITIKDPTPFVDEPERIPNQIYEKNLFSRKLVELNFYNDFSKNVLSQLPENFTISELDEKIEKAKHGFQRSGGDIELTARNLLVLAYSNYEVTFEKDQKTSEKAIFPFSPSHSNGIEDARFVMFSEEDNNNLYYATYTAFDGKTILPQLIETEDFVSFKFITLNGPAAKNKGLALFPKKINGLYAMLSRQDNENLFLMYSDNIHFWYDPKILMKPTYSWEFVQLGNCGSPIETDQGWIVLSHGVGPMRKYCIGAFLLDKENPEKVIGRLKYPLLEPGENEREGYVPNVVYTCGALIHRENLIIPYAMSDYATGFAVVEVENLVKAMTSG